MGNKKCIPKTRLVTANSITLNYGFKQLTTTNLIST